MPTPEEMQAFDLVLHVVEVLLAVGIFFIAALVARKVRADAGAVAPLPPAALGDPGEPSADAERDASVTGS